MRLENKVDLLAIILIATIVFGGLSVYLNTTGITAIQDQIDGINSDIITMKTDTAVLNNKAKEILNESEIQKLIENSQISTKLYIDNKISEIPREKFGTEGFEKFICWKAKDIQGTYYNHSWKVKDVNISVNGDIRSSEWVRYKLITLESSGSTISAMVTNDIDNLYIASDLNEINQINVYYNDSSKNSNINHEGLFDTEAKTAHGNREIAGISIKYNGIQFVYPEDFDSTNATTWANLTLYQPECVIK